MRATSWGFLRTPRILIVDDNAKNLELFTALMQAEGCEVISAAGGPGRGDLVTCEMIPLATVVVGSFVALPERLSDEGRDSGPLAIGAYDLIDLESA